MRTVWTALTVLGACQAVRRKLERPERQETEYLNGQVKLTELRNEGAAFDLPIPLKVILGASVVGLGAVWTQRGKAPIAAGLILGGGLSNLLERLKNGGVYDYVQFPKGPEKLRRYVFNLADFAVFAGVLGLLFRRKG